MSLIISNIELEFVEKKGLSKVYFEPLFDKRFVYGIITIIPTDKINEFVKVLTVWKTAQFSFEIKEANFFIFSDLSINKTENKGLITNWYKKPTSSV